MSVSPRLIRRRIKSVTNTRKITKAMELVAASKMRKSVSAVLASRPYSDAAWRAVEELAKVSDPSLHPLLAGKGDAVDRALVIVFTSDRGLCGGFNSQILKTVLSFLKKRPGETDVVAVGKKGQAGLARSGANLVASFVGLTNNPRSADLKPVADLATSDFLAGKYCSVHIAFTNYHSAISQKPMIFQLLPIRWTPELGDVGGVAAEKAGRGYGADFRAAGLGYRYEFEPSPMDVLNRMLPRLVEVQIWQALLESAASEHSARMMSMRSASDAASDMIDGLTLALNQARQAGITREIAEISSGKAALET